VFPFFMFIMGVACFFSLKKFDFKLTKQSFFKILRRSVILFLIGWAIQWFSHFCYSLARGEGFMEAINNLSTLRILGVLQRLAICYFATAIIASTVKIKRIPWIVVVLLVGYSFMLLLGNGYEVSLDNIIYRIDNAILTPEHMYHQGNWAVL